MSHPKIIKSERCTTVDLVDGNKASVGFPVFDRSDLLVTLDGETNDIWTLNASFLNGISDDAVICFPANVTGKVKITSRICPERSKDFQEGSGFQMGAMNTELDKITAVMQEFYRDLAPLVGLNAAVDKLSECVEALKATPKTYKIWRHTRVEPKITDCFDRVSLDPVQFVVDWMIDPPRNAEYCQTTPTIHRKPRRVTPVAYCKGKNRFLPNFLTLSAPIEKPARSFAL